MTPGVDGIDTAVLGELPDLMSKVSAVLAVSVEEQQG